MTSLDKGIDLLNEYFDNIYLITIPRSWEKRKDKISSNLKGLRYEVFQGCDGRILTENQLRQIADLEKSKAWLVHYHMLRYKQAVERPMSPSEIGNAESHKMVYEDIIKNGYARVLVLEDDAILWSKGLVHVDDNLAELPSDWDVWYLGYRWHDCESVASRIKRKIITAAPFIFRPKDTILEIKRQKIVYPKKFRKHIWEAGFHAGTHAYGVTLKAAELLLKEQTPIYLIADMLLAHCYLTKKIKSYISVPQIFRDDQSFPSTICNQ